MLVREILERERGNLTMIILTIFAWVVLNYFDVFNFVFWFGKELAFVVYFFGIYLFYLGFTIIYEKIAVQNRIKIILSNEYDKKRSSKPFNGNYFYRYLGIEIPIGWIITDCFVTLEKVVPVYYGDKVLLDDVFPEWFSGVVDLEYKMLHWKSPLSYQNNTKITIGENSNKEIFSIGKIFIGEIEDANGMSANVDTFEFDVERDDPNAIHFTQLGLYEFIIRFHWKRNGSKMISKKANGYIYSHVEGGNPIIRVGLGDYDDNKDVPKPLLKGKMNE